MKVPLSTNLCIILKTIGWSQILLYGYQIFSLKLHQQKNEAYLTNVDSSMSLPSSMSVAQFCYS